jgi:hypothetical protein
VLRACRRLLREGGRLAFYTIFVAPDLSDRDYRRAVRSGPPAVTSARRDHKEMLESAGFAGVEEVDATDAFLRTTRAWYEGRQRYARELAETEGEAPYEERQGDYRQQLRAIEDGLLKRSLFLAERLP